MIPTGVIPIYKPPGMTSHDVVSKVRRLAGIRRVGHTGTLDPDVAGVLPVCLGQATRIVEYVQELPKRYKGTMTLGIATDTQDGSGRVTEEQVVDSLPIERIEQVFRSFQGEIEQVPPMVSAVKVGGRRLYEWAREGKVVERKPRRITIYQLQMTGLNLEEAFPKIQFDVLCSRGTYVRTLCVDIGAALGYPAHLSQLTRVQSGPFILEDTVTLDNLQHVAANGNWKDVLYPIDAVLGNFPTLLVPVDTKSGVWNGESLSWEEPIEKALVDQLVRVYTEEGDFCAIYRVIDPHTAQPEKVFRGGAAHADL